jgi:peptide/nickel transport system substrate-binding protein
MVESTPSAAAQAGPRLGGARGLTRRALGRAAGGAAALGGLRAVPAGAQGVLEDELRIVTYELFTSLEPADDYSPEYLKSVGLAESLMRVTPRGDVVEELAQSIAWVEPQLLRVDLRPGLAFWSGRPVTAPAAAAALERLRRLVPYAASLLSDVTIEPEGDLTLYFRSAVPKPGLPLALASEYLYIHNVDAYPADARATAGDWRSADLTGFFKVTAYEPKVRATLERNEQYWGVRPRMGRITIREVPDINTRTLAALSGEAHIVRWINAQSAAQLMRSRDTTVENQPLISSTNVYLNLQKSPFEDVRVRQALSWAIDREELVLLALNGYGVANPSWLATNPVYPEAKRVGQVRQDLTRAAQLLDEAGWTLARGARVRSKGPSQLRFRVFWWGGGRPLAEVLQAQWAKVGVDAEIQGSGDYGFLDAQRKRGDWDALIESWGTFGDPASELARGVTPAGDLNYGRFQDAQMDALFAGFAALGDAEDRRQQALRINERHAELVPFIPLAAVHRLWAVSKRVRNFEPHFLPWSYEVHPDLWVSS